MAQHDFVPAWLNFSTPQPAKVCWWLCSKLCAICSGLKTKQNKKKIMSAFREISALPWRHNSSPQCCFLFLLFFFFNLLSTVESDESCLSLYSLAMDTNSCWQQLGNRNVIWFELSLSKRSSDLVKSISCFLLLSHCSDVRIYQEETIKRAKGFMLFYVFLGTNKEERPFYLTVYLSALLLPVPCCQPRETKWAPPAQRWTNRCEPSPSQLLRWLLQQRLFACSDRSVLENSSLACHPT